MVASKKATLQTGDHLAGAGFALQCWLCSGSADAMMEHVCRALLVDVLVMQ